MSTHLNQLPRSITESSRNESTSAGHSHAIEKASVKQAGIVKLVDNLDSKSKTEALTANQGRELAERLRLLAQSNGSKEINERLESALSYMATRYTAAYATYETAKDNLCKHPENSLIYVVNDPTMRNNGLWTVVGGKLVKAPWDALSSALTSEPFEVLQAIFQGAAGEKIEYEGKTYDTLATLTQALTEGRNYIQDVLVDLVQSNIFTASYLLTESGKFQEEVNRDVRVSLEDIYEHGAALPYKVGTAYEENAVVVKDGVLQQRKGGVWKSSVATSLSNTIQTFNTPEAGVDPVTGVTDGAYFNVRSSSDESYVDEYQNIGGSAIATGKSYPSSLKTDKIDVIESELADKADKSYVDTKDTSLQLQIDQKATAAYLDSALAQQTQTVNTALSQLSTFANKFYPTLAAASADIANIEVNQPVQIDEAVNGGLWYKATAGATSLTKSAYDPIETGKKSFLNTFGTLAQLEASSLDRFTYAVVTNDPDHSKNGYYQKNVSYVWYRVRLNSETEIRNFLSQNGFGQVTLLNDGNANYTTADATLTITGTGYVATSSRNYVLETPVSLSFPSNAPYRLEFNEDTLKLRVVHAASNRESGWLPCGNIRKAFSGLTTDVFKNIRVNGAAPSDNASAKTNYSLALTKASNLNFDFVNNKITVSGNIWIQYDGGRIQVSSQEIELDPARNKGFSYILLVNPTDSTMYVKPTAAPYTVPKDHLQVGAYHERDMLFYGLDHFSVNGVPFQKEGAVRPCFGWDTQNTIDLNVSDSFTSNDDIHLGNLRSDIVYGWFDDLMAQHPEYITRTFHGNDASDLYPIYSYRFKPKKPSLGTATEDTKIPKTMLITLHNEKINQVGLYILMREICNSWTSSEALASMRHGMEFVVMPLVNPWGLNHGSRPNSNGVDINRQFPVDWIPVAEHGNPYYSGTAALTEPEAQYAWQVIQDEKPDVYIDIHSYGAWNNEGRTIWIPTLNEKHGVAATAAILKIYAQYKKKYPWIVDVDKFANVSNGTIVGGGVSSKSGTSFGAMGGTLETAWNLKNEPTGLTGHPTAINLTADLIGTYILQCLAVIIDSN